MDHFYKLPPGFRFHPTEEELVSHYLRGKIAGTLDDVEKRVIPEADLLAEEPWDLMSLNPNRGGEQECFAFWWRGKKYSQGARANRCTAKGYWKSTGSDRPVLSGTTPIGMKKTLVFYLGRAPRGTKTDWVMHEYRTDSTSVDLGQTPEGPSTASGSPPRVPDYVVCRIFRKAAPRSNDGSVTIVTEVVQQATPAGSVTKHAGAQSQIQDQSGPSNVGAAPNEEQSVFPGDVAKEELLIGYYESASPGGQSEGNSCNSGLELGEQGIELFEGDDGMGPWDLEEVKLLMLGEEETTAGHVKSTEETAQEPPID